MKIAEFEHDYTDLWSRKADCLIQVYRPTSDTIAVIATEMHSIPGTCAQPLTQQLATEIRARYMPLRGHSLAWVEHHPPGAPACTDIPMGHERFFHVQFSWDGQAYSHPVWYPCSRAEVEQLIGEPLESSTSHNGVSILNGL